MASAASGRPVEGTADCSRTSTGYPPLVDVGAKKYRGFAGGLDPGGRNTPPADYARRGAAAAARVVPRTVDGTPAPSGWIVLLSVGMSNTTQEFSTFILRAGGDPRKNPRVRIVDGAQGMQDADRINDPSARYWQIVDARLAAAGLTPLQVQAVWLKEAIARPTEPFPADARRLQADLRGIIEILRSRYPNLQLVYLSSRTYAGYATSPLNPEPYAFESGFAIRWLVRDAIASPPQRPWLTWGPYLWTDGLRGRRSDGLVWTCGDVVDDGTHPSASGRQKVANLLLRFFTANATARRWFVGSAHPAGAAS